MERLAPERREEQDTGRWRTALAPAVVGQKRPHRAIQTARREPRGLKHGGVHPAAEVLEAIPRDRS